MDLNFDASTVKPAQPFEPVPSNWYPIIITGSEEKPAANTPGATYCNLELTIADGEYKGRKAFDILNLNHPNEVTKQIAYETLSAICHATGVIKMTATAQLHNIPLMAKIVLQPAGPGSDGKYYEASNRVKGYKAIQPGAAANVAAPAAPTPPAAAPTAWTPPPAPTAAAPIPAAPVAPAAPAAPVAPAAPPAPPAPTFPPEGWLAHPSAPGYFYKGQEVLSEPQLRAQQPAWADAPAPTAPVAPAAPAAAAQPAAAAAAGSAVPPWLQNKA